MLVYFLAALAPAPAATPAVKPAPPAASACPAWGAKPQGCVEPPLRERIRIYSSWRERDGSHPADAAVIRAPSMLGRWDDSFPLDAFPAILRSGESGGTAMATVRLVIAADGTIASCTPRETKAWLVNPGAERIDLATGPELGAASCALIRAHRQFRPAIDAQGRRIEAAAEAVIDYSRQRHELSAAPSPPPPGRWLGKRAFDRSPGWPPPTHLNAGVRFAPPTFKGFLSDRRKLPKRALVGVVMDFAADGQALGCEVKVPSGDARIDAATCAALLTVRNAPNRWQIRALPIEVSWSGDKAQIRLPQAPVLPGLVAPIAIAPDDVPAGDPPRQPVRIQVSLDLAGKPVSCSVDGPSYIDALDAASCRLALTRGRFTGARDVFGRAAVGGMYLRADWIKRTITMAGY